MKTRNLTVLTAVLTLVAITLIGNFILAQMVTAQKNDKIQDSNNQIELAKFSKIENKAAQQIPDKVAYELFFRAIAGANTSGLVKRAGLSDSEVERVVTEAKSFDEILQTTDKSSREIKENQSKLSESEKQNELSKQQDFKEFALTRTIDRFLPQFLDEAAMSKLQNFIYTEVKSNIQVVSIEDNSKQKNNTSPDNLQGKIPSKGLSRNYIYLYNASWHNDRNVYGSGVISETYPSETSYRTTVTITSPSGRSNTAQSSWNSAIKLQSSSLPIGLEDGEFIVQITFENQRGYEKGSSIIGYSTNSVMVGPTVNVESVSPSPATAATPSPELVLGSLVLENLRQLFRLLTMFL